MNKPILTVTNNSICQIYIECGYVNYNFLLFSDSTMITGHHRILICIPPPLEVRCPLFDIVHVESFPLLMAKAVLNECFAHFTPTNFRAPCRRKQFLSLLVFTIFLFTICLSVHLYRHLTYMYMCSRFKSANRSRFPLHWLNFSC